ncbi:hypothetical protein [Phyllobacterium endophyticum]|uniref:hypothetical protein n=1 Tax=Phyllobacterium endophyticum TaxID=1149773 RepID=UPI0011C815DB|nr:hypothetical protein [Phyllobacterium endophyticum]TXR49537.1 hypothetical protein FVA77_09530 [Phyllobacterium endophyticum]
MKAVIGASGRSPPAGTAQNPAKLGQYAVTHGLGQPAVMQGDLWLERILEIGLETGTRSSSSI